MMVLCVDVPAVSLIVDLDSPEDGELVKHPAPSCAGDCEVSVVEPTDFNPGFASNNEDVSSLIGEFPPHGEYGKLSATGGGRAAVAPE